MPADEKKISAGESVSGGRNPTGAERIEALDWLVREANTKSVWIAQGCYCLIGISAQSKSLVEGSDLRDALDALVALQEDTADVR